MEGMPPIFNLYEAESMQNSITDTIKQVYTPTSPLDHGSPIEFIVPGSPNQYLNLAKSYMELILKITDATGNNLANNVDVGPINNVFHSLFQSIKVELNGKQISDPNNFYSWRALICNLLDYGTEAQNTWMDMEGFVKDTAGNMNDFSRLQNGTNEGLKKRGARFNGPGLVQLIGRPQCDIFEQGCAIPTNCTLRLRLIPNPDNFVLVTPAPQNQNVQVNYQIRIMSAKLIINSAIVSPSMALAQEKMLQDTNMRIPLNRKTVRMLSIPAGQTSLMQSNLINGLLPNKLIFAMVPDAAMSGGYQQNPFNFHHFNMNHFGLYVNGVQKPSKPFEPDFPNNLYISMFHSLIESTGKQFQNKGFGLNSFDYAHGNFIIAVDLTPDMSASKCNSPDRTGNIRIEMRFSQALAATINLICLAIYGTRIEIDKYRNVIALEY